MAKASKTTRGSRVHDVTSSGGETHQTASSDAQQLTTNHGVPISDNQNSLKAGPRGPVIHGDRVCEAIPPR